MASRNERQPTGCPLSHGEGRSYTRVDHLKNQRLMPNGTHFVTRSVSEGVKVLGMARNSLADAAGYFSFLSRLVPLG